MSSLKDGYKKMFSPINSGVTYDDFVLLAGGGHKPITDFAMSADYVKKTGDTMTGSLTTSEYFQSTRAGAGYLHSVPAGSWGYIRFFLNQNTSVTGSANHMWDIGCCNTLAVGDSLRFRYDSSSNNQMILTTTGNLGVGNPSSVVERLTVVGNALISSVQSSSTAGGDVYLTLDRGNNASWRFLNSGGVLHILNDYTTVKTNFFDVLTLAYNTGLALFKSSIRVGKDLYKTHNNCGIDLNNSDIINANSIYTKDKVDDLSEGIHFYRSDDTWDTLTAANGILYFAPNRATDNKNFTDATKLFSNLSNDGNNLSLTIGGLTRTITPAYATNAGNATNADTLDDYHCSFGELYKYYNTFVIPANEEEYDVKIRINSNYISKLTKVKIYSSWHNCSGWCEFEFTGYRAQDYTVIRAGDYNGCNVKKYRMVYESDNTNNIHQIVIYLKVRNASTVYTVTNLNLIVYSDNPVIITNESYNGAYDTFDPSKGYIIKGILNGTATNAINLNTFFNSHDTNITLNNTTDNGIGYVKNISILGQTNGALYQQIYNNTWIAQIFQDYRTGRIATRGKNNGIWQNWLINIDSGNIGSQSVNYAATAGSAENATKLGGKNAADYLLAQNTKNPLNESEFYGNLPLWWAFKSAGYPVISDPEFANGVGSHGPYNNNNNGAVQVTCIDDDLNSGNSSGKILKIESAASGATPGLGGFNMMTLSAKGNIFLQLFRAKIPVGYTVICTQSNTGNNTKAYFLTNAAGTGKWEWYARILYCGAEGTFQNLGYVYLTGTGPVTWYVSHHQIINLTKGNYDGLRTRYADTANELITNKKITLTGTAASAAVIEFSRKTTDGGPNYIVFPSDGTLAFSTAVGSANIVGMFDSDSFRPYTNNTRTLGTSAYRWNSLYATNADLSGNINLGQNIILKTTTSAINKTNSILFNNGSTTIASIGAETNQGIGIYTSKANIYMRPGLPSNLSDVDSSKGVKILATALVPAGDNTHTLGNASARWNKIFTDKICVNNINSSDDNNGLLAYDSSGWAYAGASDTWGLGSINKKGVIRTNNTDLMHYKHTSSTVNGLYKIWDTSNLTSFSTWMENTPNLNTVITVEGDSDKFYPVVIRTPSTKAIPTTISISKNLGSTCPSGVPGSHSNGNSLWLIYYGRITTWDGNGGFYHTLYATLPYAKLCAHTENTGGLQGAIVAWLRGGTCTYNIYFTNPCTVNIYYENTNINTGSSTYYVEPRTDLGNLGVLNGIPWHGQSTSSQITSKLEYDQRTSGTEPIIKIGSNNVDTTIFRVYSSDAEYGDVGKMGFSLKYLGSGANNTNKLVLYSDNLLATTQVAAMSVYQNGYTEFANSITAKSLTISADDLTYARIAFSRGSYNYITAPANGSIAFVVNGNTQGSVGTSLAINSNNTVLVGNSSLATSLEVYGTSTLRSDATANSNICLKTNTSTINTANAILFKNGNTICSSIGSSTGGIGFYSIGEAIFLRPGVANFTSVSTNGIVIKAAELTPGVNVAYNLGASNLMFLKVYTRYIDTSSSYDLRICTAGTERIHINASNGFVGLGTESPNNKLTVIGGAIASEQGFKYYNLSDGDNYMLLAGGGYKALIEQSAGYNATVGEWNRIAALPAGTTMLYTIANSYSSGECSTMIFTVSTLHNNNQNTIINILTPGRNERYPKIRVVGKPGTSLKYIEVYIGAIANNINTYYISGYLLSRYNGNVVNNDKFTIYTTNTVGDIPDGYSVLKELNNIGREYSIITSEKIQSSGFISGGTISPNADLWKGASIFGENGNNKIVTGYFASNTNMATVAAYNSALTTLQPLRLTGNSVIIGHAESLTDLVVNGAGDVGIGTTDITSKLTVNGNIRVNGNIKAARNIKGSTITILDVREDNSDVIDLLTIKNKAGNNIALIKSNGVLYADVVASDVLSDTFSIEDFSDSNKSWQIALSNLSSNHSLCIKHDNTEMFSVEQYLLLLTKHNLVINFVKLINSIKFDGSVILSRELILNDSHIINASRNDGKDYAIMYCTNLNAFILRVKSSPSVVLSTYYANWNVLAHPTIKNPEYYSLETNDDGLWKPKINQNYNDGDNYYLSNETELVNYSKLYMII